MKFLTARSQLLPADGVHPPTYLWTMAGRQFYAGTLNRQKVWRNGSFERMCRRLGL